MDDEKDIAQEQVIIEPRKATEILETIEQQVVVLTKMIYNQDMLLKIITDRTNKIFAYVDTIQKEYDKDRELIATPPYFLNSDKEIITTSMDNFIPISEIPTITKRTNNVIENNNDVFKSAPIKQPSYSGGSERKIPVMQRITDQKGKDLFMAEVSLSDSNKNPVGKFKTNAAGKWQAHLKPGKYFIDVSKTNTVDKSLLKMNQEITVPDNATGIFVLPVAMMRP